MNWAMGWKGSSKCWLNSVLIAVCWGQPQLRQCKTLGVWYRIKSVRDWLLQFLTFMNSKKKPVVSDQKMEKVTQREPKTKIQKKNFSNSSVSLKAQHEALKFRTPPQGDNQALKQEWLFICNRCQEKEVRVLSSLWPPNGNLHWSQLWSSFWAISTEMQQFCKRRDMASRTVPSWSPTQACGKEKREFILKAG